MVDEKGRNDLHLPPLWIEMIGDSKLLKDFGLLQETEKEIAVPIDNRLMIQAVATGDL